MYTLVANCELPDAAVGLVSPSKTGKSCTSNPWRLSRLLKKKRFRRGSCSLRENRRNPTIFQTAYVRLSAIAVAQVR